MAHPFRDESEQEIVRRLEAFSDIVIGFSLGLLMYIEDQNSFKAKGSSGAIVAGKPDIIAVKTQLQYSRFARAGDDARLTTTKFFST